MNRLILLLPLIVVLAACNNQPKNADKNGMAGMEMKSDSSGHTKDGVFIHISSGYDNPHKALMPLKMALMMSNDKDVAIYMDIEAVRMVLRDSKDLAFADFPNLKDLLGQLTAKKVLIMACPTCLKIAGKGENDLIAGVTLAEKDKFFNFTKGKIITLDY